ncbi:MAG: hypothetical protein JWL84_1673 [Rhodospirillales bacterium]|jgi:hypothetical protein|nr:hypothetical protein [Rhodospirillales bacterium]
MEKKTADGKRRTNVLYPMGALPVTDAFPIPILPPDCGVAGRCYLAYPSLSEPLWLLPQNRRFSHLHVDLYRPQRPLGWMFKRLMQFGAVGPRVWLDNRLITDLEVYLAATLKIPAAEIAISLGTPGRYRKTTLQVIGPSGEIVAYAKMAKAGTAVGSLEAEFANLTMVSQVEQLRANITRLIGWGEWDGSKILLLYPGPRRAGPYRLGPGHLEFLSTLHTAFVRDVQFEESDSWARLKTAVGDLSPELSSGWQERCRAALTKVQAGLRGTKIPHSFAHGDFAPWNIRASAAGLFVFDWEAGCRSAFPFHDAFHFTAAQSMMANRANPVDTRFIKLLAQRIWPEGEALLPWAYLVYLLEKSVYYAEARIRAPSVGDNKFNIWLAEEMDRLLKRLP